MAEKIFPLKSRSAPEPPAPNDRDNAEVFIDLHGHRFRYDPKRNDWLHFPDGKWFPNKDRRDFERAHTWQCDAELEAMLGAEDVYYELLRRAKSSRDPDEKKQEKQMRWAIASGDLRRVAAILRLAQPRLKHSEWDTNPYLLGCANGVVDLRTGQLRDGRPEEYLTRSTGIAFDPAAKCAAWDLFLSDVMEGDSEMIAYLWRVIGYALTGDIAERAFFLLVGVGRNGKTVFVETLRKLLGGYAQKARFSTFLVKNFGGGVGEDVASLAGARLVIASETSGKLPLDTALVKELTGGDTHRSRHLYEREFEFTPQFKLMFTTNKVPPIYEDTRAIWDRLHYVEFNYRVPEAKVDRYLGKKLEVELPGILARAVTACLEWQSTGLRPPEKILKAGAECAEEMDDFGTFLRDTCEFSQNSESVHAELVLALRNWWADNFPKRLAPSSKALRQYLTIKATELKIRRTGEKHHSPIWRGLGLKRCVREQVELGI
jgi:putative DNA primase/helicase